ncbi:MAG TPA: T9SS type A sorting domain-containing protein, partial [Catalimonadaceae bacterium]|nr:T9SS type A sorting domain-containing protein [Catalimonadaceae bacterium]
QANNYQVKTVQFDYRRVFSTIMQDWLGASNSTLNYTLFDQTQNTGFGNQKLPQILKPVHVVPDNCYGDSVVTGSKDLVKNEVSIFPNHASDQINIVGLDNITQVKMMDAEGRVVRTWTENLRSDKLQLQLGTMADGMYVVNIQTATRSYSRKIFVKKQ